MVGKMVIGQWKWNAASDRHSHIERNVGFCEGGSLWNTTRRFL